MNDEVDINDYEPEPVEAIVASRESRHNVMSIKLNSDELQFLCRAADFYGKSVIEFMREAALKAAQHPWVEVRYLDGHRVEVSTS